MAPDTSDAGATGAVGATVVAAGQPVPVLGQHEPSTSVTKHRSAARSLSVPRLDKSASPDDPGNGSFGPGTPRCLEIRMLENDLSTALDPFRYNLRILGSLVNFNLSCYTKLSQIRKWKLSQVRKNLTNFHR